MKGVKRPKNQGRIVIMIECQADPNLDVYQYDCVDVLRDAIDGYESGGCIDHPDMRDYLEHIGIKVLSVSHGASK